MRRADLGDGSPSSGYRGVLLDRFREQVRLGGGPTRVVDLRKVENAAICVFTIRLDSRTGFKFRRSGFARQGSYLARGRLTI